MLKDGYYIIDNEDNWISYSEWDSKNNDKARFVAISSPTCYPGSDPIVISKNWFNQYFQHVSLVNEEQPQKRGRYINDRISSYMSAPNDMDGLQNFHTLLFNYNKLNNSGSALQLVSSLSEDFKNRKLHFYIPSFGQLKLILSSLHYINDCLSLIGSKPIDITQNVWMSSSASDDDEIWFLYEGEQYNCKKTMKLNVLPLVSFNEEPSTNIYVLTDNGSQVPINAWNQTNNSFARFLRVEIGEDNMYISTSWDSYAKVRSYENTLPSPSNMDYESSYDGFSDYKDFEATAIDSSLISDISKMSENFLSSKATAYLPSFKQLNYIADNFKEIKDALWKVGANFIPINDYSPLCTINIKGKPFLYARQGFNANNESYMVFPLFEVDSCYMNTLEIYVITDSGEEIPIDSYDKENKAHLIKVSIPNKCELIFNTDHVSNSHIPHWQIEDKSLDNLKIISNVNDAEVDFDGYSNCVNAIESCNVKNHQGYSLIDTYNNMHIVNMTDSPDIKGSKTNLPNYLPGIAKVYDCFNYLDYVSYVPSIGELRIIDLNLDKINEAFIKVYGLSLTAKLFSGALMDSNVIWISSSQYSNDKFWGISDSHFYKCKKTNKYFGKNDAVYTSLILYHKK